MADYWWIERDLKGSSSQLTQFLSKHLVGGVQQTNKSHTQDNRCPCRYSNPTPPGHKSERYHYINLLGLSHVYKVKLSLSRTWSCTRGIDIQLYSFFISATDGGERPTTPTPIEWEPGWGPGLVWMFRRKVSWPFWDSNTGLSNLHPVNIPTELLRHNLSVSGLAISLAIYVSGS
jgi:hypothetical protein